MLYKINNDIFYRDELLLRNIANPNEVLDADDYILSELETVSYADMFGLLYEDQWIGTADAVKMTLAMMQEASEAMNELDFKPWKKKEVNWSNYKEELADVFIFLMICFKIAGMNADEVIKLTFDKHNYNKIRKDHDRNK